VLFIAAAVAQINQPRTNVNPPARPDAPAPAEQPAAAAPTLDSSYLVGHWTSDASCASSFNGDGTFTSPDGSRGLWNLSGDQLTLTGNSTLILQVTPIDANNMNLVQPDGSTVRVTRC
jgi:hypothetical protein